MRISIRAIDFAVILGFDVRVPYYRMMEWRHTK